MRRGLLQSSLEVSTLVKATILYRFINPSLFPRAMFCPTFGSSAHILDSYSAACFLVQGRSSTHSAKSLRRIRVGAESAVLDHVRVNLNFAGGTARMDEAERSTPESGRYLSTKHWSMC